MLSTPTSLSRLFVVLWALLCSVALMVAGIVVQAALPTFTTPYVTRAEAVMLLIQTRVPQVPDRSAEGMFSDVKRGEWYERYLVIGNRLGIIAADPKTRRIRPESPVTRAEFLRMAGKTYGINGYLYAHQYRDVPYDSWTSEYAGLAKEFKLFPADADPTLLKPGATMIHTEVARAVHILNTAYQRSTAYKGTSLRRLGPLPSTSKISFSWTAISQAPGGDPATQPLLRQAVIALVNRARKDANVPLVKEHPSLTHSAQQYAEDMATGGFFGHTDLGGRTIKDRMEASGYYKPFFNVQCLCIERWLLGENIASGQRTPQQVMDEWMRSSTHHEAILNPIFTDVGVGISSGIWVQHFGGKQK